MKVLPVIKDPDAVKRILSHLVNIGRYPIISSWSS